MPDSGFVRIDDADIFYEVDGAGPPVVFAHGSMLDTRMWDDQVEAFAQHFQVIRFDQRGYGKSSFTLTPYRSHEDFLHLFRSLEIKKPHLVGLSTGGRFAIDFAISYPNELRSLTVAPGGISGYEYEDPAFEAELEPIFEAAQRGDLQIATELLLEFPPMRPAASKADVRAKLHSIISDYSWLAFREEDPWLDSDPPALDRLGEISVPTLIVVGELDIADHRMQANILKREIQDARLVQIPDAGHMVNMEQPNEFNRVVLDFLTTHG